MLGAIFLIIITFFLPPIGVLIVSGCSVDLLINILLTILGYIPGHIHAYYIEYVYYHAKENRASGGAAAPGIYSERVQLGRGDGYGTMT